jgi:hypothetical protein
MSTPENPFSHQPKISNTPELGREQMERFLLYRKENSKKLNGEVLSPYYEGSLTLEEIKNKLGLSEEQTKTISFMLDSFSKPKSPDKLRRKDGSYIGVHSLQLFLTARDYFQLKNGDLLDTLLVHDIAEDTLISLKDITEKLGLHTAELAATMTEERDEDQTHDSSARKRDVVVFAEQIKRAGSVATTAEMIDRMDDIADLSYLLDQLSQTTNEAVRNKIQEKLSTKFGKCLYTIQKAEEATSLDGKRLAEHFHMLLKYQLSSISATYGINITDADLQKEIASYQELENELIKKEDLWHPERGKQEKHLNDLNVQVREVVSFLGSYLSSSEKKDPELYKGLEKFTREELMDFLKSMGWVMDWYFDTKKEIENYFSNKPKNFQDIFVSALRTKRRVEERGIRRLFLEMRAGKTPDPELKLKLDGLTLDLESNPSEQEAQLLRQNFPTGNYLLHTTDIHFALGALQDKTILSAEEISRRQKTRFDFGGGAGIRFNMNDVRVLTGNFNHFAGFMLSPETALEQNQNCILTIPPYCAEYEVALIPEELKEKKSPKDFEETGKVVSKENLPKISIDQVYIFCNRSDVEDFKLALASNGLQPKGILYYSPKSLRVESWIDSIPGDHQIAGKILNTFLSKAGVHPTINWKKDLFPSPPAVYEDGKIATKSIPESFSITNVGNKLRIEK